MALREGAPGEGSGWGKEGVQKSDRERWRREIVRERVPLIGTDASLPRVECILESRCPKVLSLYLRSSHPSFSLSRSLSLPPPISLDLQRFCDFILPVPVPALVAKSTAPVAHCGGAALNTKLVCTLRLGAVDLRNTIFIRPNFRRGSARYRCKSSLAAGIMLPMPPAFKLHPGPSG